VKKIILFGSGTVAEKNLNLNPEFIVDNNLDLHGAFFHGVEVKAPSILKGASDKYKVIVCTTSISEVKKQLESYGYQWGVNADVAVLLNERIEMASLEDSKFSFLISSGLPSSAESFSGGGIYHVEETDSYPKITLIYEGNTHGLIKVDDGYVFSCQGKGLVFLDSEFKHTKTIELRAGLRPHGIRKYNDLWVLVSSYKDAIICVNDDGEEIFEYQFSDKIDSFESAQHHCNDLDIVDDYAYVSMFSLTGNWKRNSFDGGIMEVNLKTGEMKPVINNLTMPHSVTCDETGLKVLNSFKGTFLGNNFDVLATLPGFVRGLDSDENYYYLGESKNRNFSRLSTGRTPVSIDTKITIINKKFGFCRSVYLANPISEVHSIIRL
tara:strand:- start:5201 stop:6340 length:1140 start_codon:yes stop_codon:yes gene_type:complete